MRLFTACALLAIALGLAACGQNGGSASNTVSPTESAANAKAAGLMPPFAPLFPSARVQSSIGTGTGPNAAGTVSFATDAQPEAVIAFYRERALADGMEETPDTADTGTLAFTARKDDMQMQVLASPGGSGSNVQVLWARHAEEDDD